MILKFFRDFLNDKKSIKYQIISDESSFNLAVKKLHSFRRISLDTEFIWRKTYFPILSLIQIKLGSKIFIFDCMKLNNLNPLTEILEDDKILKIIHSSRSDSNVLFMSKHIRIKGTFDIQAAENILDKEQELVAEELKNSGKPDEIAKKISLGKMNKFKEENALLTQAWVMEPKKKVEDVLKELSIADLKIKEFYRIKIGE